MNVEIGAEAALFPEKEYISGIFVPVWNKCIFFSIKYKISLSELCLSLKEVLIKFVMVSTKRYK
jgi:hypothetical protein